MIFDPRYSGKWDFEFKIHEEDGERVFGKLNWGLWYEAHSVCLVEPFFEKKKERNGGDASLFFESRKTLPITTSTAK